MRCCSFCTVFFRPIIGWAALHFVQFWRPWRRRAARCFGPSDWRMGLHPRSPKLALSTRHRTELPSRSRRWHLCPVRPRSVARETSTANGRLPMSKPDPKNPIPLRHAVHRRPPDVSPPLSGEDHASWHVAQSSLQFASGPFWYRASRDLLTVSYIEASQGDCARHSTDRNEISMAQNPKSRLPYVYRWLAMTVFIAALIYVFHLI